MQLDGRMFENQILYTKQHREQNINRQQKNNKQKKQGLFQGYHCDFVRLVEILSKTKQLFVRKRTPPYVPI